MKVYKNGICREIDLKRKQEFIEKGYKAQTGGEENGQTGPNGNGETEQTGEAKAVNQGKK